MTILKSVGVYRRCVRCQKWRKLGSFHLLSKVCKPCYVRPITSDCVIRSRTIMLTDKGRAYLREMEAA